MTRVSPVSKSQIFTLESRGNTGESPGPRSVCTGVVRVSSNISVLCAASCNNSGLGQGGSSRETFIVHSLPLQQTPSCDTQPMVSSVPLEAPLSTSTSFWNLLELIFIVVLRDGTRARDSSPVSPTHAPNPGNPTSTRMCQQAFALL